MYRDSSCRPFLSCPFCQPQLMGCHATHPLFSCPSSTEPITACPAIPPSMMQVEGSWWVPTDPHPDPDLSPWVEVVPHQRLDPIPLLQTKIYVRKCGGKGRQGSVFQHLGKDLQSRRRYNVPAPRILTNDKNKSKSKTMLLGR